MAEEDVTIRYLGDPSGLEAALKSIQASLQSVDKSSARTADTLESAFQRGEKSAKEAEGATKKLTKQLKESADASGDTERVMLGLSDILERVGLDSAAAGTRLGADLGGGIEAAIKGAVALGPSLLAVGAVAVTLGGTYLLLNNRLEEAEAKQEAAARAAESLATAFNGVRGISEDLETRVALINGEIDKFGLAAQKEIRKIAGAYDEATRASGKLIDNLEKQRDTLEEGKGAAVAAGEYEQFKGKMDALNLAIDTQTKGYEALLRKKEEDIATADLLADYDRETEAALKREQEGRKAAAEAARVQAEQERLLAELEGIRSDAADQTAALTLDNYAQIRREEEQQIARIQEIAAEVGDVTLAYEAEAAVHAQAAAQINAENAKVLKSWEDQMDTLTTDLESAGQDLADSMADLPAAWDTTLEEWRQQVKDTAIQTATELVGATGAVLGAALTAQESAIQDSRDALQQLGEDASKEERQALLANLEAQKEAALKLWRGQKAASITEALINGAVAITKSLATLGPIAGAVAAVGVGATTAAQVATIAAQPEPEFHVGLPELGPLELRAVIREGESVLTPQGKNAIGGPDGVTAANQGRRPERLELVLQQGARTTERQVLEAFGTTGAVRKATRDLRPSGRLNPYRSA